MSKFKLRKNRSDNEPDYKYELDINTTSLSFIKRVMSSTIPFASSNDTSITLYSNDKQELMREKRRIERMI